ncbi:hypothetical protein PGT21_002182 [Puccinia graminis f. sp. tritici]|uniref:Uncharacterized protein n=1 Tax=Puccinia graminis f. sp. tritici TaxID=56615 RepID=A0A5B0P6Y8_PUCGR|nr:hypothetical protein PGT21_002182 [Puccinia graminis f. sp. tritici]
MQELLCQAFHSQCPSPFKSSDSAGICFKPPHPNQSSSLSITSATDCIDPGIEHHHRSRTGWILKRMDGYRRHQDDRVLAGPLPRKQSSIRSSNPISHAT